MNWNKPSERHLWVASQDLKGLKPGERFSASRVLHVLMSHANQENRCTYVHVDTIARESGLSERTTRRCIPLLEAEGLILVNRKRKRGNVYFLVIGDLDEETMARIVGVFSDTDASQGEILDRITDSMVAVKKGRNNGQQTRNNGQKKQNNGQHGGLQNRVSKNRVNKTKETPPPDISLPACVNPDTWADFVEHRASLKTPMSSKAKRLMLEKLEAHHLEGHDPNDLMNTAIMNGWKSVYPPRLENKPKRSKLYDRLEAELKNTCADGFDGDFGNVLTLPTSQKA